MIKRKDKTVKQLQAECRKRKIGFMMNWTKAALVKRLEDEDKREKEIIKVQDESDKKIRQAQENALKEIKAAERKTTGVRDPFLQQKNQLATDLVQKQERHDFLDQEYERRRIELNTLAEERSLLSNELLEEKKALDLITKLLNG